MSAFEQRSNFRGLVNNYALSKMSQSHQANAAVEAMIIRSVDKFASIPTAVRRKINALSRLVQRMVEADLVLVLLAFQASGVLLEAGDPLGDQAEAIMATWRKELAVSMESTSALMDESSETAALTLARVLLAARRAEEALSLLQHLTQSARIAGHTNAVIGALVLSAMAKQARGARQAVPALADLEEALYLAEPGGYVRVFLDEGKPMIQLLKALRRSGLNSQLKDYIDRLLRASTQNHH
jgi:hypothetical protein